MAVPFSSTNEQELLAREADSCTTDATVRSWPAEPDSAFELFFSIAATSQWLVEHQLHRVALQFPDAWLGAATRVQTQLHRYLAQHHAGHEVVSSILADTSYHACCIDEVAASHWNADCIVHYGPACLTKTSRLPSFYVFGRLELDLDHCVKSILDTIDRTKRSTLVFYDEACHHALAHGEAQRRFDSATNVTDGAARSIHVAELAIPNHNLSTDSNNETSSPTLFGRVLAPDLVQNNHDDTQLVWIGATESDTFDALLVRLNQCQVYSYNPSTRQTRQCSLATSRKLQRRYFLVQKAKDAQTIGILAGTLATAGYLDAIARLRAMIRRAGKKDYTLAIGKLNPAKLANFADIDVFVLVACPLNSMIDSRDLYKPIVTPFELELALAPGKEWTGEYTTDFRDVFQGLSTAAPEKERPTTEQYLMPAEQASAVPDEEEEEMRFSLTTGRLVPNHKFLAANASATGNASGALDLSVLNSATQIVESFGSLAVALSQREWKGLEVRAGETPVVLATEGRSGLPMEYQNEPARRDDSQ